MDYTLNRGILDAVPALASPGEFVMRKVGRSMRMGDYGPTGSCGAPGPSGTAGCNTSAAINMVAPYNLLEKKSKSVYMSLSK